MVFHSSLSDSKSPQVSMTLLGILAVLSNSVVWMISILLLLLLLLLFTPWEFFPSVLADGFSLEFEWQQVSSSLLSILAVLNNVVAWMVSYLPKPPIPLIIV